MRTTKFLRVVGPSILSHSGLSVQITAEIDRQCQEDEKYKKNVSL
jgi:hypothetical protein